jgi:heat shock protein HslJ
MVSYHRVSLSMVALLALAVTLGGCIPSPADSASLEGTHWALVTLEGEPPLTGTIPSAEFSADEISGSTGCNQYFGAYAVTGTDITIKDVARTEMYCADPEGVMDQGKHGPLTVVVHRSQRANCRADLFWGTGTV